jgi:hypothetical protein
MAKIAENCDYNIDPWPLDILWVSLNTIQHGEGGEHPTRFATLTLTRDLAWRISAQFFKDNEGKEGQYIYTQKESGCFLQQKRSKVLSEPIHRNKECNARKLIMTKCGRFFSTLQVIVIAAIIATNKWNHRL